MKKKLYNLTCQLSFASPPQFFFWGGGSDCENIFTYSYLSTFICTPPPSAVEGGAQMPGNFKFVLHIHLYPPPSASRGGGAQVTYFPLFGGFLNTLSLGGLRCPVIAFFFRTSVSNPPRLLSKGSKKNLGGSYLAGKFL